MLSCAKLSADFRYFVKKTVANRSIVTEKWYMWYISHWNHIVGVVIIYVLQISIDTYVSWFTLISLYCSAFLTDHSCPKVGGTHIPLNLIIPSSKPSETPFCKNTLRLHGMSWGVKTTCFKAPGVSLGGSGVSIEGVRSLRLCSFSYAEIRGMNMIFFPDIAMKKGSKLKQIDQSMVHSELNTLWKINGWNLKNHPICTDPCITIMAHHLGEDLLLFLRMLSKSKECHSRQTCS